MDLRQLEYFVAVAEEASFTAAARRVHISQSGVSAQVRQLERELGTPLIDRSRRVASLTAAGEAALDHARAALAAAESVRRAVVEVNDLVRGRLVVAMVTACRVAPLFDALARFHRAHPGIEITLVEDGSDRMIDQVRAGALDLALVGCAPDPPRGLDALSIVREPVVAAVHPDHPLAGRSSIDLGALADHPVICLPAGTGIRTAFDLACAARGVRPDVALQANAPDTVADLAARGLGVAVLTESLVAANGRLRPVGLTDATVPAVLALVWRPGPPGPALRELLDHCRRALAGDVQPSG